MFENGTVENGKMVPSLKQHCEVTHKDLPLSCPMPNMRIWDGHPRVYLPIQTTGKATCPYCGTHYTLVD